jgi:hypothetical protein
MQPDDHALRGTRIGHVPGQLKKRGHSRRVVSQARQCHKRTTKENCIKPRGETPDNGKLLGLP